MAQSRRLIRRFDLVLELFEQQALLVVGAAAPSGLERKSVWLRSPTTNLPGLLWPSRARHYLRLTRI
jgi:hypothetical protein